MAVLSEINDLDY